LGPVGAENEDLGEGRVDWRDGGKIGGGIEGGRKRNQDRKKKKTRLKTKGEKARVNFFFWLVRERNKRKKRHRLVVCEL